MKLFYYKKETHLPGYLPHAACALIAHERSLPQCYAELFLNLASWSLVIGELKEDWDFIVCILKIVLLLVSPNCLPWL